MQNLQADMIDDEAMQTARADSMLSRQRAAASAAAYEQLRQITAISLAANMVLLAALIWALTT